MQTLATLGFSVDSRPLTNARREMSGLGQQAGRTERQVGGAIRGIGSVVARLTPLFAGLGAAFTLQSVIRETEQLQRNMLRTEAIVRATGETAGFSAQQLHEQSRALAAATLQSTEGIMEAQQVLLTFRSVSGDTFTRAQELAMDLATVTGGNLTGAMNQLGRALEDPVQGITALRRSGVSFTDAQREMIQSLVDSGDQLAAQNIILDELAQQYGGVARQEAQGLAGAQDTLGQAVQEVKLAMGEALGVGERLSGMYDNISSSLFIFRDAIASGEIAFYLEQITSGVTTFADEALSAFGASGDSAMEFFGQLGEWASQGVSFAIQALRDFPNNMRAMVQLATVEILVLVDRAQAYGSAIAGYLDPRTWFSGDRRSGIEEALQRDLAVIRQVRDDSISAILDERKARLDARNQVLEDGREMRREYQRQQEELERTAFVASDTATAIKEVADEAKELDTALISFADKVKDSLDPMRELQRQAVLIKQALEAGLLDPAEARAYMKALTDGAKEVGNELGVEISHAGERLGAAAAQSIIEQDWSAIGNAIGGIVGQQVGDAVGNAVAQNLSQSMGSQAAGMLGGIAGGFAGAAAGAVIGGLLSGRQRTITREIEMTIENMVGSAFEHVRIRSRGMLGSSTQRFARSLGDTTVGIMERSFEQAAAQIESQAGGMGMAAASLEDFAFTLRREGLTVSEFTEEAAQAYVQATFAAVTDYQYAHENIMDTWNRMARDARNIGQAFERETGQAVGDAFGGMFETVAEQIREQQRERISELRSAKEALSQAESESSSLAEFESRVRSSFAVVGIFNDDLVRLLTKKAPEFLKKVEENIADANARIAQAHEQATQEFYQGVVNSAALLGNIDLTGIERGSEEWESILASASATFAQTTDAWIEATQGTAQLALRYQQQATTGVNNLFEQMGVSMVYSAGRSLDEFDAYFSQFIDDAVAAAAPEDMATVAGEAQQQVSAMRQAILQAGEAAQSLADSLLGDLRTAINARQNELRENANAEIELIRKTASARENANRMALDAAREGLREMRRELQGITRARQRLLGEYEPAQAGMRADAIARLESAIASGDVSGTGDAAEIAARINEADYTSSAAFQAEQARTLNLLAATEQLAEEQVDNAELAVRRLERVNESIRSSSQAQIKQLQDNLDAEIEALEELYNQQERQVNALLGIDDSVMSVEAAVRQIASLLGGDAGNSAGGAKGSTFSDAASWAESVDYARISGTSLTVYDSGTSFTFDRGNLENTFAQAREWFPDQVPDFHGSHAAGLGTVPFDGYRAELHQGEMVLPSHLADKVRSGSDSGAEIAKMRTELMAGLRAIERNTREIKQIEQRWDRIGLPEARELV